MFSVALATLEVVLVLVGIYLLYWWTNKEATEANKNLQDAMPGREEDYLKLMVKKASENKPLIMSLVATKALTGASGHLRKNTVQDIQSLIVYYATRVGISMQAQFRRERRELFAIQKWSQYRKLIEEAEKTKQSRMVKFTSYMLDKLEVDHKTYIKSMQLCPAHLLAKTQEHAILRAYTDWYEINQRVGGDIGLEPVTEKVARMAEVEYQVKMAALQNAGSRNRNELDLLVERYKIEDFIYDTHRVETEHLLLLKKE